MAVVAEVGTFTRTTADGTGDETVTLSNGSLSADLIVLIVTQQTSDGIGAEAVLGFGFCDASLSDASISISAVDGVTTSDTERTTANTLIRHRLTGPSDRVIASISSISAGQFVVNYSEVDVDSRAFYLALDGLTAADVDEFAWPTATPPASVGVTTPGFQPNGGIFVTAAAAVPNAGGNNAIFCLGVSDASLNTKALATYDAHGAGTTNNENHFASNKTQMTHLFGTHANYGLITSWDANGFTYRRDTGILGYESYYAVFSAGAVVAGSFVADTTLTTPWDQDIPTTGCNPKAVILFTAAGTTVDADTDNAVKAIGISDGSSHASAVFLSDDNVATTACDTSSRSDRALEFGTPGTPTIDRYLDGLTMGTEKFTVSYDGQPGSAYVVGFLAIGDAPTAGTILHYGIRLGGPG